MKVPGFFGETVYRAGAISAADIPLKLLVVGTKLSTGTATANADVDNIFSEDDADTKYGAGSQIARMCYAALRIPGVQLQGAAVAEAGGAAAGTATITIAGTWSSGGTFLYRIDGTLVTGSIASTDSATDVAVSIVNAVNGNSHLPTTAANVAGVVTLTRKSKGATGNQGILYQDKSQLPSGMTSTLAGGTAVTGDGLHFTSGSGTEDVTTLLAVLKPGTYARVAFAQNDATNAALWEAHFNFKAGVLEGRLEHGLTAVNGTLSAANSLATVTLNAERVQLLWLLNSESHPSEVAAVFGAIRTVTEQSDPSADYDGKVLPGVAPQAARADWATLATQISALDNGITPIVTTANQEVQVVRSIVTHCLNGATPDYRILDTYQAVTPDYMRNDVALYWTTVFRPQNPKVNSDPAPEERDRPSGVATPSSWTAAIVSRLRLAEDNLFVTNVDTNMPFSEFDPVAKRIMSVVPVVPSFANHQVGVSVRQVG